MSYAAQQDMVDRFGSREVIALTDRSNTGAIDATVLARGLSAADDEINAYLAARYTLPLASTPLIVRDFACDIARYRLCGGEVTETQEVRDRYKDAIRFFEKVSKGEISLGLDGLQKATPKIGGVKVSAADRVFNAKGLAGY